MLFLVLIFLFFKLDSKDILNNIQSKKALIFGVTGQDGSYLAEFLLEKGYEVHGVKRRASSFNTMRVNHLKHTRYYKNFILHYGDISDSTSVNHIIKEIQPDEIYNLAAQSHVLVSFETPEYTGNIDALGTLRILESIKSLGLSKKTRFYQASTSEMFGLLKEIPQTEHTPFYPRSPYGAAKLYSHWITVNYRESYGLFACSGILFNHESPRRGDIFITKKITKSVARISKGLQESISVGNLDAKRDWGYAKDYVEAMWLMLQQNQPDDYVIATGETHSVREFIELTFKEIGIEIGWKGTGLNEIGYDIKTNKELVHVDPKYFRPAEVNLLIGDASKAKQKLGWTPKVKFNELIKIMIEYDLKELTKMEKNNFSIYDID